MNLEGRNLEPNMSGDDVRRLQTELNQLGFTLGVNGFFDSMTYLAVRRFQQEHGLEINGIVDEETARRINAEVDALTAPPLIVKGQVRQADGDPANGVLISAFDVDLRNEQLLGQTQTDRKGFYQIQYSAEQFSKREKGKADLIVKVLSTNDVVVIASPILFNAPQLADLTRGDFSVVKMLKQEFSVRQPEQIRTLAKRSESEWVNLVRTKHATGEIKLPIEIGAIAR